MCMYMNKNMDSAHKRIFVNPEEATHHSCFKDHCWGFLASFLFYYYYYYYTNFFRK